MIDISMQREISQEGNVLPRESEFTTIGNDSRTPKEFDAYVHRCPTRLTRVPGSYASGPLSQFPSKGQRNFNSPQIFVRTRECGVKAQYCDYCCSSIVSNQY